ncbi:histidine kinase dimerization/phosphoacceptor domain -containing protein [Chitinophaga sp. YR573]|uniref:histidine kinase dimerization/phosphoacceptor domain -containing protein n=1 Tax=Chitinophaga sp. YR573 TaxID=1881040 RepID=UPI0015A5F027|nr:histidine kinase dimerization/phosphoacceptor domain -containing protein [Chitinophaga sp. YR573]
MAQNNLDRDSVMLIACRITGLPFLLPYTGDDDNTDLINAGKVHEAIRSLKSLKNEERLQLLIELATWYLHKAGAYKTDLDSANYYIQEALTLSANDNNRRYECLDLLGEYYRQSGNEPESKKIYLQIVSSSQKEIKANAWHRLGQLHTGINSSDLTFLNNSLVLYQQSGLKEKQIELLWNIADCHLKSDISLFKNDILRILEIQKSIGYKHSLFAEYELSFVCVAQAKYLEGLNHANAARENMKWSGITALEGTFDMRLGVVYWALGKNAEALTWFKKGLENRSLDTHLFWFKSLLYATSLLAEDIGRPEESLSLMKDVISKYPPITPWEKAQVFSIIGACYARLNNYRLADENYMSFFKLSNEYPGIDPIGEFGETYLEIANFYLSKSNLKSARLFAKKVMSGSTLSVWSLASKNYMLFQIDSFAGNYKSALSDHIQYKHYADSVNSIEQRKKFDELMISYGAEKKDRDIKILEQEKKLQGTMLLQEKFTRNWILGGVVLLLIIVGLLVYNMRLKQRTNKKLEIQRKAIEEQNFTLRHLVNEKDWLVKEIHHRVKNNLQTVMSLLNSQSVYIDNDAALTAIHDSQHRVHAMSLIHQKLYNSENVSAINMSFYIRELVSYLRDSFNTGQRIRFEFVIEPLEMDVSQAVPLGLILNEAIVNAIKYAFPDGRNGIISITLSKTAPDRYLLSISDNGIGMPAHFNNKKSGSLGMSLMAGLSEDLDGVFSIENNIGTTIKISFMHELGVSVRIY